MLIDLAQHVVADARAREAEGDFPSPRRYSAEQVESALVTVADALLAAEAKADAFREALVWYKDSMCEGPPHVAECGHLSDHQCSGCNAARALTQEQNNER
jgi:hypothetical protein